MAKKKKAKKDEGLVVVPLPVQKDAPAYLVGYSGDGDPVYSSSGDRTSGSGVVVYPMTWADAVAEVKTLRSSPAKSTIYKLVPVLTLDTRVWQEAKVTGA